MGWLSDLLQGHDSHLTFEEDLELLVARWTNRTRRGEEALSLDQVVVRLKRKIKELEFPNR